MRGADSWSLMGAGAGAAMATAARQATMKLMVYIFSIDCLFFSSVYLQCVQALPTRQLCMYMKGGRVEKSCAGCCAVKEIVHRGRALDSLLYYSDVSAWAAQVRFFFFVFACACQCLVAGGRRWKAKRGSW